MSDAQFEALTIEPAGGTYAGALLVCVRAAEPWRLSVSVVDADTGEFVMPPAESYTPSPCVLKLRARTDTAPDDDFSEETRNDAPPDVWRGPARDASRFRHIRRLAVRAQAVDIEGGYATPVVEYEYTILPDTWRDHSAASPSRSSVTAGRTAAAGSPRNTEYYWPPPASPPLRTPPAPLPPLTVSSGLLATLGDHRGFRVSRAPSVQPFEAEGEDRLTDLLQPLSLRTTRPSLGPTPLSRHPLLFEETRFARVVADETEAYQFSHIGEAEPSARGRLGFAVSATVLVPAPSANSAHSSHPSALRFTLGNGFLSSSSPPREFQQLTYDDEQPMAAVELVDVSGATAWNDAEAAEEERDGGTLLLEFTRRGVCLLDHGIARLATGPGDAIVIAVVQPAHAGFVVATVAVNGAGQASYTCRLPTRHREPPRFRVVLRTTPFATAPVFRGMTVD
jgi:hypothetical protein